MMLTISCYHSGCLSFLSTEYFSSLTEYHAVLVHIKTSCGCDLARKKDKYVCATGAMLPASCPVSMTEFGLGRGGGRSSPSRCGACCPCCAGVVWTWRWVFVCPWLCSRVWWEACLGSVLFCLVSPSVISALLGLRQAVFVDLGHKMRRFWALGQMQRALQPSRIYFLKEPG